MIDLLFVTSAVAILATPGPTNTLLAASGAGAGFRRSLRLVAAELAGYLLAIMAWGFVLAPIAEAWPMVQPVMRLACAAYLAVTAVTMWRSTARAAGGPPGAVTMAKVFTATLLNPKALIFAVAVFPPAAFAGGAAFLATAAPFVAILVPIATAWIGIGAGMATSSRRVHPGLVHRLAAVVLGLFSASIGVSTVV